MEQRTLQTIASRRRAVVESLTLAGLVALLVSAILALAVAIVPAAEPTLDPPGAGTPPAAVPAAPPDSTQAAAAAPDSFAVTDDPSLVFQVQIGNRMYPDWKDVQDVHLNREFPIGDTENSGKIVKFLPSFMIVDGKPRSVSANMDNPAVRIMVYFQGAAKDSAWAFLNFPPHFSPKSFYTFQLKSITGYGAATAGADSAAPADNPTHDAGAAKPKPQGKPKPASGGAK
jgi:hypothetical protein